MTATANLELPYIASGQAQKHVTHNEAIRRLDAIVHLSVASRIVTSPPSNATEGKRYLIPSNAEGLWAGHQGEIAVYSDGGWEYLIPKQGWLLSVNDADILLLRSTDDWIAPVLETVQCESLGINGTPDAINRLTISSSASLFNHENGDHRLKINKASSAQSASIIFQSNFVAKTEIGATGSDGFHVKTNSTVEGWRDRLFVDHEKGYVGIGTTTPVLGATSGSVVHIHAGGSATDWALTRYTSGAQASGSDGFIVGNLAGTGYIWNYAASAMIFGTSSFVRMVINADGKVGIGTATPTSALHVSGAVRVGTQTKADLPSSTAVGAGAIIYVPDATGGGTLAFSDGTSWRRVGNGTVVD